ncbi:related to acetylhydrolase [Cephalotrichum gorgonifer]|uniref:Putative phospholipase n=1 Tax=Cephalotrichum gorgonifer TaxID=2041049 RepID=A0AAE8SZF7_9PEZI|nr:related to acetylhydrolase [Cephalotrichum gorgonifer]
MPTIIPVPSFPAYTGPHRVGTLDVEIPVSELPQPCARPEGSEHIATVQFRVFYPTEEAARGDSRVSWLPQPQRKFISGYSRFAGAKPFLASMFSYLPRHLYHTTIPASKNAPVLPPTTATARWPLIIFSHGLGGSRNAYSHVAGSLASHGAIVVCTEHRDGSAVTSFIRDTAAPTSSSASASSSSQSAPPSPSPSPSLTPPARSKGSRFSRPSSTRPSRPSRTVPYSRISHDVTPEMYTAREAQLRIRLWEVALIYESLVAIDRAGDAAVTNLNASTTTLAGLKGAMDLEPGKVVFSGHSFGSATTIQLLKSTYYADSPALQEMKHPLFVPAESCALRAQITERTPAILLDLWATPLLGPSSAPLLNLPLPAYAPVPDAPGGAAVLAILSEAFYGWSSHLLVTCRILAPTPAAEPLAPDTYLRADGSGIAEPRAYYVRGSAHQSQSDFGVLFPWLLRRALKVEEPERVTRLNLRAMLQFLRRNGVPVARTCGGNMVEGPGGGDGVDDDPVILEKEGIETWEWLDTVVLSKGAAGEEGETAATVGRTEAGMESELEAGLRAGDTSSGEEERPGDLPTSGTETDRATANGVQVNDAEPPASNAQPTKVVEAWA